MGPRCQLGGRGLDQQGQSEQGVTIVRSTRWKDARFFLDRSEGAAVAGDAMDHIPHGVEAADAHKQEGA